MDNKRSASTGQITIGSAPVALLTDCFNAAIQGNFVSKVGQSVRFACGGTNARNLFQGLREFSQERDIRNNSGQRSRVRYIVGSSNCQHFYEAADGSGMNHFMCNLYFDAGPFINR